MNLTAQIVSETFKYCLFKEGENTDNPVYGEGARTHVGFNPERLQESIFKIVEMLNELPDSFKISGGGGMSFLNMGVDKNNNEWTGLHRNIDELVCLGLASGKMTYLIPREMWSVLPGGMPYLVVLS